MMGRARSSLVWLLAACGCQGHDLELPRDPVSCSTDRDCPSEQPHCAAADTPDRPAIVACNPECQSDAQCPADYFCDLGHGACSTCVGDCTPDSCAEGFVCQPDGRCVLVPCMDAGAPACPAGWRCDPFAPSTDNQGAKPSSNDAARLARGCARNPCAESDGVDCNDLWRCDPAQSKYSTGCFPLPCGETGRCSDETAFICTPTNDGPRTDGVDPHGCVYRNCSEGVNRCDYRQLCEDGACRPRTCAELACPTGTRCIAQSMGSSCEVEPLGTGGAAAGGTGGTVVNGGTGGTGFLALGHCE